MPFSHVSLLEQKRRLRAHMRAERQTQAGDNASLIRQLSDVFHHNIQLAAGVVVASYHAFRDEADPQFLADRLRAQGHPIALPVIVAKGQPLIFRLHNPQDSLIRNGMGIWEPAPTAPTIEPDVLLVPMLAFDAQRNRLGYGGGFYDRTMTDLRSRKKITTIGIAYACQQTECVPTGGNDIPLDKIVTEIRIF